MKESIVLNGEDGTRREFTGGRAFVEAVAKAASKEELAEILRAGGVEHFDDDMLETSYCSLALSQNWDAVWGILQDTDYAGREAKLRAHGIPIVREDHELINALIATGSNEALIAELRKTRTIEAAMNTLHAYGYYAVPEDFLLLVREQARHLYEDALLTREEIAVLAGRTFQERCKKSINLIFALSTIAGLALGVSNAADPAMLLAIAGGISLIYGEDEGANDHRLNAAKQAEAVVGAYKKVEEAVTGGYKAIEDTVVNGYKAIEKKFVDTFLEQDEESGQT